MDSAIAGGEFTSIWVYVAAPFLGAVVAAAAYQFLRQDQVMSSDPVVEADLSGEAA